MMTVKDIYKYLDTFAPFDTQCDWDNAGLLVGEMEKNVSKVAVTLDLTESVLDDVITNGCELVITHHPVIFSPLKQVKFDSIIAKLCKNEISVISAHTNLDKANGGINDILCSKLNVKNTQIFGEDIARIGVLENILRDDEFALYVKKRLGCANVKYVPCKRNIKTVAVCGGAGAEFMYEAIKMGADALVTADTKHHELIFAADNNFCIVDAGHYSTENIVVDELTKKLQLEFKDVEFISLNSVDPIKNI